ncbi:hypothetical protein E2C01_092546 [Portunus trituberculatus]|uniref:Secreted protein n=1 Tax=Portunus trituberculatus TaxID=210409 RepID=A0A5B7JM93_PORTR|nr:hypothetical protein [Portunus trituberculatus]
MHVAIVGLIIAIIAARFLFRCQPRQLPWRAYDAATRPTTNARKRELRVLAAASRWFCRGGGGSLGCHEPSGVTRGAMCAE